MAIVAACGSLIFLTGRPAGADELSDAQSQATQLQQEIQSTGEHISALGQQFDRAQGQIASLQVQVAATQGRIASTKDQVVSDQSKLRRAALMSYMSAGESAPANPLFDTNQNTYQIQRQYQQLATGNITDLIASLHTAQSHLSDQHAALQEQEAQAANAANAANAAEQHATQTQLQQNAALAQVKGRVGALVVQQQATAEAAARAAAEQKIAAAQPVAAPRPADSPATASPPRTEPPSSTETPASPAPSNGGSSVTPGPSQTAPASVPPSSGGAGATAVAAAESFLGVPYVFGGASRSGVDCSGLTMLAWQAAGVSLPHYSGDQMSSTQAVSVSDLQPGDLLFYGPGGSEHVAMYIGGGSMIEAPFTGAVVRITGLRLGDGFVGATRP